MHFTFGIVPIFLLIGQAIKSEAVFNQVKLENNAYSGLLVAINPEISEDPKIVETLKDMITEASQVLFTATHKRAYFGNVTILVPNTWTNGTYNSTQVQSYDSADVLVANPNPMYGDNPYTLQYGQCGDPGSYIHFTPNYLNDSSAVANYGPRGKAFVHEWAHLRWGVFDEAPTYGNDPFYWDSKQKVQATRCPLGLNGEFVYFDEQGNTRGCNPTYNGLPEEGCMFVPYRTQNINASLMSHQFIDEVVEFCDDANSTSLTSNSNAHNTEATNEHNRLCGMRSVWSIMRSSVDFNGVNLPNDAISDVTPTFTVARARPFAKFVLVLDVSGSMGSANKLEDMQLAANLFVTQYLVNGSKVGIVPFSSAAYTGHDLVLIDDNRESLAAVIASLTSGGGTCIGCGITEGIKVLEQDGEPTAGGHVIVLSDGMGTVGSTATDDALKAGVVVDSVYFGVTTVNYELQYLVEETQGVWYFNEAMDSGSLIETFKELAYVNDGDPYKNIYQIHSQSFTIPSNGQYSGSVLVDSTIGNNTVFTFTYSSAGDPLVLLYSPSQEKYCSQKTPSDCVGYATTDHVFNTITFQIPETATVGEWVFDVTTVSYSADVDVIVTSMASNREIPPMVVESGMSQSDPSNLEPIVVYATVSIGYAPVIEADVLATITAPSGKTFLLTLLDTGSAPDVRKSDGVYSRYFTEFVETGSYSVQVKVTGLGNGTSSTYHGSRSAAAYNPGYIESDGTIVPNPNGPAASGNDNTLTTSDIDPFTRVVSPGGFSYTGVTYDPTIDVIPPGKVIDLAVEQVDNQDLSRGVRLTFSAPGSDYDSGTARAYQIRYSYDSASDLANNFKGILITKDLLFEGDVLSPKSAGTQETLIAELIAVPHDRNAISVWFALRAYDDSDNVSPTSNIAMMNVFVAPYVDPTTAATTEPVTSPATQTTTFVPTSTPQPITTTTSTTTTTVTTTTVGKSDTGIKLDTFQIVTIVLAVLCFILVCGLIGTWVLKYHLDKQRKKYRVNEQLEMGGASQNGPNGNEYRELSRPQVKVEGGSQNSSYLK